MFLAFVLFLLNGCTRPDHVQEIIKQIRETAEQGDANAQYKLAMLYSAGTFFAQDDAEAVNWYHKAAKQGHAEAQFCLGVNYYKGIGVSKNQTEAERWLRKAAEQEHSSAQSYLNFMAITNKINERKLHQVEGQEHETIADSLKEQ